MPQTTADAEAAAAYVYGVVRAGSASPGAFAGVDGVAPDAGVEVLEHGGLAALVSAVPLAEFGEEAIAERLRDPAWLASRAQAHSRVLERALDAGAVVPFRFGAIFRGREEVVRLLADRRDQLGAELERLSGKVELGVKAFAPSDLAERLRLALPEVRRLAEELEGQAPGKRYLLERRLAGLVAREAAAVRAQVAEESHSALATAAVAAASNALRETAPADGDGEMLLNGSYLVDEAGRDGLAEEVRRLEERHRELGIRYELTGPWPPFNFVEGAA